MGRRALRPLLPPTMTSRRPPTPFACVDGQEDARRSVKEAGHPGHRLSCARGSRVL